MPHKCCQRQGGWPDIITFMIAYPKAKEAEGKAFTDALEKMRNEAFNNLVPLSLPKADHPAPKPAADDEKLGFIPFVRSINAYINCNSAPTGQERGELVTVAAGKGERTAHQPRSRSERGAEGRRVDAVPGGAGEAHRGADDEMKLAN